MKEPAKKGQRRDEEGSTAEGLAKKNTAIGGAWYSNSAWAAI